MLLKALIETIEKDIRKMRWCYDEMAGLHNLKPPDEHELIVMEECGMAIESLEQKLALYKKLED